MRADQPRIRLERSGIDGLLDGLAIVGWMAGLAVILASWSDLPERLPMHFDVSGHPDRWGPRVELFIIPTLSFVLLIGLAILSRFPHIYNYLVAITEQNAPRQYRLAVRLIQSLNILLQALFAVIVVIVIRASQGLSHPGVWLVPVLVAGTFVLLIIYLAKASSEPSSRSTS